MKYLKGITILKLLIALQKALKKYISLLKNLIYVASDVCTISMEYWKFYNENYRNCIGR